MNNIAINTNNTILKHLTPILALVNPLTSDMVINPDGRVFIYENYKSPYCVKCPITEKSLERIAYMLASISGKSLNAQSPYLSAIIPKYNYRVEILIPPAVKKISMSIRIPQSNLVSLDNLYNKQMFSKETMELLKTLVKQKKNIIISGETGSGKTTLLSALINEIDNSERLIIIEEETKEINTNNENVVSIITNKNSFTGQEAVRSSLRMNPDRIIYGETRDGASCLEMLKAWRTGHNGGLATIHSTNAKGTKGRIEDLLLEVCPFKMDSLINDSLDVVIQVGFENDKRIIKEILELKNK